MNNKVIKILLALLISGNTQVYAAEAFCGLAAKPPEFPFTTMIHAFSRTVMDQFRFPFATTTTTVTTSPVPIANNPRTDTYNTWIESPEYVHGIVSGAGGPPPSGTYSILGVNTMWIIEPWPLPPYFKLFYHPGGPFTCNDTDIFL